jgi:hypothetical protein
MGVLPLIHGLEARATGLQEGVNQRTLADRMMTIIMINGTSAHSHHVLCVNHT